MTHFTFIKALLFLALLLPTALQAEEADDAAYDRVIAKNEITCGVIPWAPYKVLDPNTGEWSGFAVEIYRKAFATLDMKITFKEVVLGAQIEDLKSGRVDAICDDGPYTMSAGKFVEYSDPLYFSIIYPYMRIDETRVQKRSDLNHKEIRFTGIDGDLSSDLVHRLFPKASFASMPGTTDVSQLFLNVATKKADVVLSDPAAFAAFAENNPGEIKPLFKGDPLGKYKTVISVKKGNFKLLGLVNQAVDNALAFGLVDEELNRFDPTREKLMRVRSRATFE